MRMRSGMRRTIVLITTLAFVSAGTTVAATSASAGTNAQLVLARGGIWWKHYGDRFTVKDRMADGYWIKGFFRLASGGGGTRTLSVSGAGKERSTTFNRREGSDIRIKMCYYDELVALWCSDWINGVA
ncbi:MULTISPECIES: hypothetical protein [Actinomadura]|uniref:Secreted protein n=1 Tax=Actinomadura yumaensis TaxID=111807 RepID=A0ABW2CEU1_9ACTN|nr:hypothetical protein [Actinomadura sp. J1-007]MWK34631.1 hypothetical protein [Actinomadura sp. J1-007]